MICVFDCCAVVMLVVFFCFWVLLLLIVLLPLLCICVRPAKCLVYMSSSLNWCRVCCLVVFVLVDLVGCLMIWFAELLGAVVLLIC